MTVGTVGTTMAAAAAATTPGDRKLLEGAHEFEAMLVGEMLKPLHFGEAEGEDADGDADGGAAGTIRGMGTEALAKGIAAGGGLGVAHEIFQQIRAERALHDGTQRATKV